MQAPRGKGGLAIGERSERTGSIQEAAVSFLATAVLASAAALSLAWWFGASLDERAQPRVPDEGNIKAAAVASAAAREPIGEHFLETEGRPSSLAGSWPRFRGADLSNVAAGGPALSKAWAPAGPPVLWTAVLGEGHGGPAVQDGRVYLLDYDEARESDALRCLSLDDGREIWRRWYRTKAKRNHGISRTVPTVAEGFVVTMGPKRHVMCVEAASGRLLWGMDLVREYGTEEPLWFAAQNPLIDAGRAIIAQAGRALMVAVDCASGRVLWETPNPMGWKMSHSSVVPMNFGGRRMFVYCALGGMAGVSADGPDAGSPQGLRRVRPARRWRLRPPWPEPRASRPFPFSGPSRGSPCQRSCGLRSPPSLRHAAPCGPPFGRNE